jgi:eukaryotic-like serine/threonine-protein kinase
VVVGNTIYLGGYGGSVAALNATTGAVLWTKYTTGSEADIGPLVANGIVYYGEGSGPVYAWNATTGAQLWDYTMPNASEAVNGEPVVVGNTIYLGGYGGSIAALSTS